MAEMGTAAWAGREIQQRDYYYFYKALSDTLQQERAQLKELGYVANPMLLAFGTGTRFGNAMGEKWQFKPDHLIELAYAIDDYELLKTDIERDDNGDPHPTHPDGAKLLHMELCELELLFAVSAFRAYGGDTIMKWMHPPEEKVKQDKGSLLAKILGTDQDAPSE